MAVAEALGLVERDARYSLRGLLRTPLFTLVAVLTLAIGTGANTAVFSVVDGVLLKPLPYPQPDELVSIWHDAPGAPGVASMFGGINMSPSMLMTYRAENRSFASIGLWQDATVNVTGISQPEQVRGALVSGGVLQTLGVPPLLGRWLDERDESLDARVAMLSYGYWQTRFGGDAKVLGKTLMVNGFEVEVVGVMPEEFRLGDAAVDVIGPYRFDKARLIPPPFCCFGVARLKPGVTLEQANADVARMLPIWIDRYPFANGSRGDLYLESGWRMAPALRTLKADVIGDVGNVLWVVMAMIAAVLLIACANVTNLLLVRGEARSQEFGVRAALGEGTWPIARRLLVEAMLLACVGGVLGIVFAYAALQLLLALAPPQLPRLESIVMDARASAFASALTVVTGVLVSVVPVLRAGRAKVAMAVRAARGGGSGHMRQRAQSALVVGQVALALVLLVSSGLMLRTASALRTVEPGFAAPESLQTFRVLFPQQLVPEPEAVIRQQHAILDAIEALPGVSSAGFVSGVPMEMANLNWDGIDVEGSAYGANGSLALRMFRTISPGYLATMGTRVVAGRDLDWNDIDTRRPLALVSENLARELWQSPSAALGKKIRTAGGAGPWREVVGVVEDVRMQGPDAAAPAIVYWPAYIADYYVGVPLFVERAVAIAIRTPLAGSPALLRQIEQAVWSVNADLPLASVRTMKDIYDRALARTSFTLTVLLLAAGVALVLGAVGLYGVLSYAVSQRRREIAIRLALGARQRDVRRQFVRHGVTLAGLGVVMGLAVAAVATRLMASLLYDVRPVDPLTYAAVAAALTLVAAIASYWPARRASAVDPAESLAAE